MKAFPNKGYESESLGNKYSGMDLRDYFACHAMPTIFNMWNNTIKNNPDQDWDKKRIELSDMDLIATDCYAMADAMMEARNDNQ